MLLRALLPLLLLALAGCSTTPISGRSQFTGLPGPVQSLYAEAQFQIGSAVSGVGVLCTREPGDPVGALCPSPDAAFEAQVARVAGRMASALGTWSQLESAAVPALLVLVRPSTEADAESSARGRVLMSSAIGRLGLPDEALALIVARELGHVLARHHEERSALALTASIATSLVLPAEQALRAVASLLTPRIAQAVVEERQRGEADAIGARLLWLAGYEPGAAARSIVAAAPRPGANAWLQGLAESARRMSRDGGGADRVAYDLR